MSNDSREDNDLTMSNASREDNDSTMSNDFPDIENYSLDDDEQPNLLYALDDDSEDSEDSEDSNVSENSDVSSVSSVSSVSPFGDVKHLKHLKHGETEPGDSDPKRGKPMRPIVALLYSFIAPVKAWKELRRIKSAEEFASGCFYPLVALATASSFMSLVYDPEMKLAAQITRAVVIFIAFFLGYFCVFFICRYVLPEDARERIDTPFGRIFLMTGMSTLAIFFTIGQFLPDLDALLVFLPLFTIYLSARGARFLRLKRAGENITGWIAALLEIFVPYAIYELFPLILPTA